MATEFQELDVRRRLLDAAGRLLSEEGPSGLSTRRLAKEVGTSTMSIYTHFGGLPALVDAVVREGFARLAERLATISRTEDPLNDLATLANAYRDNALANPHLYSIMVGSVSFGGNRQSGAETDEGRATFAVLIEGVRRAVAAGRIRSGDPEELAGQLWAALHGYVSLELAGYFDAGRGDTGRIMWPMLLQVVGGPNDA